MGSTRTTNMAEAAVAVVQSVNETGLTASQFDTIYNVTSFGLACMMASTAFFFLRLGSMTERYKEALCYTGLVTFIAFYHYYRIFNSFDAAFTPCEVVEGVVNPNKCSPTEFGYSPTGHAFNDAYRYMDWLLTVPLLLIEIVLVMKLSPEETKKQSPRLGVLSGLMTLTATLARAPAMPPPGGPTGLCPCCPSATSCTPSSSASRSRGMPSPSASVIRSSGLAGPPSSRGAPTRSCTSCRCFPAPPPARLVCPPPPWSPSRSATPSLT